jgi:hypothetical protein
MNNGWTTVGRTAPAAFSSGHRTWQRDETPAFGGNGGRRAAPAAFGGGGGGHQRLEERAAEARYKAECARKAEEEEARKRKAMDVNDEESYPVLGARAPKKGASTSATVVVNAAAAAAAPVPAPVTKSRWAVAAPAPAAASTNQWASLSEPSTRAPTMAERIAAASARVDAEEAERRAQEEQYSCAHYTPHQRRLASLPRRTLDDDFDYDPAHRAAYDEDDEYYAAQEECPPEENGEDNGEFNADLHDNRRRGDKGVW